MKASIKKKWVAALRSGEYEQGKFKLRREETRTIKTYSYCCLGVLCDLYRKEKKIPWSKVVRVNSREYPPRRVQAWSGLHSENPIVSGETLSYRNDTIHNTFKEIATKIQKSL